MNAIKRAGLGTLGTNDLLTAMSHHPVTESPSTSSHPAPFTAVEPSTGTQGEEKEEETGTWIFGYGSLCWNQGFNYEKSLTGYIRGFSRKFWQGNTTHRGTQTKPGRVATLVEEKEGIVWGQAFQVKEKKAFSYLENRECKLGGYLTTVAIFHPRQGTSVRPFPVLLYLATPSNTLWLGDSPLSQIAHQILESAGSSGHNVEYLLRLASFVRENIPEAVDEHLFTLECLVRAGIEERKLCLKTLMGEREPGAEGEAEDESQREGVGRNGADAFQFTATLPSKKLRCVNI